MQGEDNQTADPLPFWYDQILDALKYEDYEGAGKIARDVNTHVNSARVLLERYLARSPRGKLLRTALRELDDAMHGEMPPHDEELAQ